MNVKKPLYPALRTGMRRLVPLLMTSLIWQQPGHSAPNELIRLPQTDHRGLALEEAVKQRRTVREFSVQPISLEMLSQLLWAAQGITHTKGLRTAPSAGALYPLEVDVIVGSVDGLPSGVYRYQPQGHRLAKRLEGDHRQEAGQIAYGQGWMADAPVLVIISAVAQRTARKYGRRAELYVPVEAGAAAQNVLLQAVSLDLSAATVGAFDPSRLQKLLGTKKEEETLLILPVGWEAANSPAQ